MSTISKMVVSGILVILVVALGSHSIIQVNAQTMEDEKKAQEALQKQDCMQLKGKMTNDEAAAAQYKSKDCESLLK